METIIEIDVTTEDIKLGRKGDCGKCPIALAICRALQCKCSVNSISVNLFFPNQDPIRVYLPSTASNFVFTFDHIIKGEVKPFKFVLDLERTVKEWKFNAVTIEDSK